ncbi:ATP-dependent RNA helicase HrpA [Glycomyces harbinensis]|uniref:RNA helicase n=1 Tax=Glycomyces harbinensis TaxID=58114 RepID=A0A1G6STZ3_9ACTN|nr:ATP-dependent RNA helicase HrpA [Glycomyces harbinensis]SDD20161.1 ATP-dependent helicase HrpA [Glycomyces harbinensis]
MPSSVSNSRTSLHERVSALRTADQRALRRRLREAREREGEARTEAFARLEAEVERKEAALAARAASVPKIVYPEELPVSQRKDDILEAIRDNQVVIIAGETGSGKTTQIPKICLELGRGVRGMIGHTQPRRIAARAVAERIAEELGSPLGEAVGWKVRFNDQVSDSSLIKVMTDGILLTEIQRDRLLSAYDTIIIDEAHERSLNIDFILGCLRQILPQRRDLKVIVTSATIDPERFAAHFASGEKAKQGAGGEKGKQGAAGEQPAPILEVSGRTYPVEVRYRPLRDEEGEQDRDQIDGILDAVNELSRDGDGDILVFLSGEQEIRDTADALEKAKLRHTEVVPLYARLSAQEQHRVFASHTGRRIILSTNVAETSLTVPGIRYVVDAGYARISRYSARTKVQRLPIEAISQASANQRAGRCGRVAEGICIRLYSEDDFNARPEFTDAEILRTNLASVILQMTAAKLGRVETFPFVDAPDSRNIKDGMDLLVELGALEDVRGERRLTNAGRDIAKLPIDPRLARMILQARDEGCVRAVAVITAAMSIQDPKERPSDKRAQADQSHARFNDPDSDFSAYLNLWRYLEDERRSRSSSAFRRMCKQEYLHYLRIREWQDLVRQILGVLKTLKIPVEPPEATADPKRVHTALLAGLLSHIGVKEADTREYLGGRNAKFAIFPGSGLAKKQPRWVVAGELVETSRLWGRVCAKIEPEWVEPLAEHLLKRTYSEPHWSKKAGAVLAFERVTLYGVPIVARRSVNFGRIDIPVSRELFIRHALVQAEWETHHKFLAQNLAKIGEVEDLESRVRQRGLLADEQTLFDFYDERLPADIVSGRHFDSWWKKQNDKTLLDFDEALLLGDRADGLAADSYPEVWTSEGADLELDYEFEPGSARDGVTVAVPLPALQQLDQDAFTWQVPGLRADFAEALIKSLPKTLRRSFVPAPDFAKAAVARMEPAPGRPMMAALADTLKSMTGVYVPADAFDLTKIPGHLLITFRVTDEDGSVVAEGKELGALQKQLAPKTQEAAAEAFDLERTGLKTWDFDALPKLHETPRKGYTAKAYPALVDEGGSVGIKAFPDPGTQAANMWAGTRRLLRLNTPDPHLKEALTRNEQLALATGPYANVDALLADCVRTVLDKVLIEGGGPAWDREGFEALLKRARPEVAGESPAVARKAAAVLTETREAARLLEGKFDFTMLAAMSDMRRQLDALVGTDGFVGSTGWWRLDDLHRYVKGIAFRARRVVADVSGDKGKMDVIHSLEAERDSLARTRPAALRSGEGREVRWMIEELRVSFFAQQLGTRYQVSEKRIKKLLHSL